MDIPRIGIGECLGSSGKEICPEEVCSALVAVRGRALKKLAASVHVETGCAGGAQGGSKLLLTVWTAAQAERRAQPVKRGGTNLSGGRPA